MRCTAPFGSFRSALGPGLLLTVIGWMLTAPALAIVTTVVDSAGEPIEGARVCYIVDHVELLCAHTDSQGSFELPTSGVDTMRAVADGYNATTFSVAALEGPISLERSPILLVRLTDRATGERLEEGEVVIVYSTGKEEGPFPANAAGVRIRKGLTPGEIRVIGKADGFVDSGPEAVTLEAGGEFEVVLELDVAPEDDETD